MCGGNKGNWGTVGGGGGKWGEMGGNGETCGGMGVGTGHIVHSCHFRWVEVGVPPWTWTWTNVPLACVPLLVFHLAMEHVHPFQAVHDIPLKFGGDKDWKWGFAGWVSKQTVQ